MRKPVEEMNHTDLKEKIKNRFPDKSFVVRVESKEELVLEFESDNEDYNFYISSELLGFLVSVDAQLKSNPNLYFWYDSIEQLNVNDNDWNRAVEEYLFEVLAKLTDYKTRIIQDNGLCFTTFKCEYFKDEWQLLTKNRGSRWTLKIPKINGHRKVYY